MPADIIITNVNLVDVNLGEVAENYSIVVKGGYIVRTGRINDIEKYAGPDTLILDGKGNYLVPGMIDLHIHIESSMLDPLGFSKVVLRHGTTTVIADPHEITNVLGLEGFRVFSEATKRTPLKILLEAPSCVPATDPSLQLETTPHAISAKEIAEMLSYPNVIGLGEVMDFVSVLNGEKGVLEKICEAEKKGLVVDGHAPLLFGEQLDAYISAGILSDHESTELDEAMEKARKGMYVYMREGSAWRDLASLIALVKKRDCKLCAFVSDDVNVLDLMTKGHMDRIVNIAIELGLDPIRALQYVTINPAIRLHMENIIGIIAPGRLGDMFLTERLDRVEPHTVLANGEVIYYRGQLMRELGNYEYPDFALKTVKLSRELINGLRLRPRADARSGSVQVNVIQVALGSALTKRVTEELKVSPEGYILPDERRDVMYVSVIDRHTGSGSHSVGFIKGLRFNAGAIAQTVAHDTHNLIVAGWREEDMRFAVKKIYESQGGIVVVDNKEVVAEIPLGLAGLMSVEGPEKTFERYTDMLTKLEKYGVEFESFFMTLALVSLPVIPEIRITDRGLVDVIRARHIPLISD